MKHWRYVVIKQANGKYRISEYFHNFGHTEEPITLEADTKKELIQMLEWALYDAKKYRTVKEKEL